MIYKGREYQTRMTGAALADNVLLAAPPGLGKTAAVADAVDQMVFDRIEASRILIVGPKIVVEDTWPNELKKWSNFHRLTHRVWTAEDFGYEVQQTVIDEVVVETKLRPADAARLRDAVLADGAIIHLVSRDNFYCFALAMGKAWNYDVLVLDESGAFSDMSSKRYQTAKAVVPLCARVILLNGTPIGNRLEKLWAQMCLVDGGAALTAELTQFRMKWMKPDKVDPRKGKVFSWKPEEGALEEIIPRCRGRLVTMLEKDWLDLPDMVTKEIGVQIPMGEYKRMERELYLELGPTAEALAVNAGVLYNKLAQIACGIIFDTDKQWHEIHRVKLGALAEVVDRHGGPLLIWTSFKPDLARIKKLLPKAVLANQTKDLERRWNAGELPFVLAHPESLAYGANLQDCPGSGMCWFGVSGNAEHVNQGVKRLHRGGRKEPVTNYVIVARGTVEERMLAVRAERSALESDVMAALAYRPAS